MNPTREDIDILIAKNLGYTVSSVTRVIERKYAGGKTHIELLECTLTSPEGLSRLFYSEEDAWSYVPSFCSPETELGNLYLFIYYLNKTGKPIIINIGDLMDPLYFVVKVLIASKLWPNDWTKPWDIAPLSKYDKL